MDNSFRSGWNHIVKDDDGFYVGGKLTNTKINLDGFYIVDMKIYNTDRVWLKLEEKEYRR